MSFAQVVLSAAAELWQRGPRESMGVDRCLLDADAVSGGRGEMR